MTAWPMELPGQRRSRRAGIVYFLPCRPGAVYVNVTDGCLNECRFCIKREGPWFFGQYLGLEGGYPSPKDIVQALESIDGWPLRVCEIVFCGMGEPLLRYNCVLETCKAIKEMAGVTARIRVDTSGLHWQEATRLELLEHIEVLSVSLNAESPEKYEELCRPRVKDAFGVLMSFLKAVKQFEIGRKQRGLSCPEVRLSVVDTSEEGFVPVSGRRGYPEGSFPVPDIAACERIASSFGWSLIVKRLFRDSREDRWDGRVIERMCIEGPAAESCLACPYRH